MASFWKEARQPGEHAPGDMAGAGATPEERARITEVRDLGWWYLVRACGFTFRFGSLAEIQLALDWFSQKTHPTSRYLEPPAEWPYGDDQFWKFVKRDGDAAQRWHERLPQDLTSNHKRPRVVNALQRAIREFSK